MGKTKRGGSSSSSRPQVPSTSSSRAHNQTQASLRRSKTTSSSTPSNIQDVYDFAVNSTDNNHSNGKKQRLNKGDKSQLRASRRALAGMAESDPYSNKNSNSSKGKNRERNSDHQDDDDDDDENSDQESEEDEEMRDFLRAPKVFDDLDELNAGIEGEDEEIDSDEAFGESDEEKFSGWSFQGGKDKGGTKRKGKSQKSQDFDEEDDSDSEEEEEGDGDEEHNSEDEADMMDISKLLDGGGDSESEEEEEVESEQDSSEEVDSKLQNLLSNLSSKRSLEEDESSTLEPSKKARHVLSERTESMPESEYASGTSNQQLRLEDLLDPLNGQSGLSSLRNSTRALGNGGEKTAIASKRGGGALSAPLASIIQDKLDRKAAYELTKEEVEGWKPTIKRLREAEHLSFPLQETKLDQTSTASLTANFKAQKGGLEDEIERMLMESGMTERQLKEEEELKMKELDPKEVKRRREELKKMRELMFRAEIKAKRISKIKSKAFRKIARKEKERERKKLEEAGLLGDEEDGEMDEESRMKKERDRAMERATLKHKNTSKWAKNSLGRNHQTQESRNAIEDQLRRGEELRRKIHGFNSDSEDEEEDEDEEFDSDGDRIDNDREKAFDELKSLEEREEKKRFKDEIELDGKHKNVMNMKFMKDARKKNEARNRGEMDEFRNQMEKMGKNPGQSEDEEEDQVDGLGSKRNISSNGGRAIYGTGRIETQTSNPFTMEKPSESSSDSTSPTLQASDDALMGRDNEKKTISNKSSKLARKKGLGAFILDSSSDSNSAANPWLVETSKGPTQSKKKNQVLIGKEGSASSRLENRVEKQVKKGDEARRNELEDAKLEISMNAKPNQKAQEKSKRVKIQSPGKDDSESEAEDSDFQEEDSDDEREADELTAVSGKGVKTSNPNAFKQRKLVSQAFAGDDVSADFALQKARIVAEDGPKTEDLTLPGWGSWGGQGTKQRKNKSGAQKRFVKEIKGLDPEKRKDRNMKNVIINEKKDKKNEKYKAKDLPFPYTSKAQYEMDMKSSIGKEWNTTTQNQRLTLPKVVTKPGKVIKPIEKKF